MKKLYTALCMAAVAGSAFAITPNVDFKALNVEASQANLNAAKASVACKAELGLEEVMATRSFTDPSTGYTWNLVVLKNESTWSELLVFGEDKHTYTFEEFPFYLVSVNVSAQMPSGSTDLTYDLFWPAKGLWQGNDSLDCPSVEEFANGEDYCRSFLMGGMYGEGTYFMWTNDDDTEVYHWGIWDSTNGGNITTNGMQYNGKTIYDGFVGGTGTEINFDACDGSFAEIALTCILGSDASTESKPNNGNLTLPINYEGDIVTRGFEARSIPCEIKTFDLFYNGEQSSEDVFDYVLEWGPLSFYNFMIGTKEIMVAYDDATGAYKFYYSEENTTGDVRYGYGAFYAETDVTGMPANGSTFTLPAVTFGPVPGMPNVTACLYNPEPSNLLPYYSQNAAMRQDGCVWLEGGTGMVLQEGTTLTLGTTDGLYYDMINGWLETYQIRYKGNITFHPDPNDITKTESVPAVGTATPGTGVKVIANETINVMVDGNNIIAPEGAVIYDLNGRMVNANGLATGVYVVRVNDKAAKVFVK